jgi:hypothetical protein
MERNTSPFKVIEGRVLRKGVKGRKEGRKEGRKDGY